MAVTSSDSGSSAALTTPGAPWTWARAFAPATLATAAVLLVLGIDFYFDVRGRDFLSWLDPRMFFDFAVKVRHGQVVLDNLMVPTVFPYFVAPFASSFAGALWVNFLCFIGLAWGIHLLRRPLRISAPAWVVVAVVLLTPLAAGLSRTLFSECLLTATLTLTYAFWLGSQGFTRRGPTWAYAAALALALLSKTTAPVFVALPLALQALALLDDKKTRELGRFLAATAAAIAAAALLAWALLPYTRMYFQRLGNLSIWAMRLIGPGDSSTLVAYSYYPWQLLRNGLWAVGLFLLVPLYFLLVPRREQAAEERGANLPQKLLWLWLVVPLIALSYVPQREPRHILPCVVPAVLLIFMGLSRITRTAARRVLTVAVVVVAVGQYLLLTHHRLLAPYFFDRPLGFEAIAAALLPPATSSGGSAFGTPGPRTFELQHWEYATNIGLAGFDATEAFCLGWQLNPAVVYDLDRIPSQGPQSSLVAYKKFEDLFSYTHFSLYNRSLGWRRLYYTLDAQDVVANADYILLKGASEDAAGKRFPHHQLLRSVQTPGGRVLVLRNRLPTTSYRELYARQFLRRLPAEAQLDQVELDTICYDLVKTRYLAHQPCEPAEILPMFPPGYKPGSGKREIYWVATRVFESEPKVKQAYERFLLQAAQTPRSRADPVSGPGR